MHFDAFNQAIREGDLVAFEKAKRYHLAIIREFSDDGKIVHIARPVFKALRWNNPQRNDITAGIANNKVYQREIIKIGDVALDNINPSLQPRWGSFGNFHTEAAARARIIFLALRENTGNKKFKLPQELKNL